MYAREQVIAEDPSSTMKDIFGDLNLGGQASIASLKAVEGERLEPKAVVAEEDIEDRGNKGCAQANQACEESLPGATHSRCHGRGTSRVRGRSVGGPSS